MENNKLVESAKEKARKIQEAEVLLENAKLAYHKSIKNLHETGMSYRDMALELGLSHQRVHQIVSLQPDITQESSEAIHCSFCKTIDEKKYKLAKVKGTIVCHTCLDHLGKALLQTKSKSKKHKFKILDKESKSKCLICSSFSGKKRYLVEFRKKQVCSQCIDQLSTEL